MNCLLYTSAPHAEHPGFSGGNIHLHLRQESAKGIFCAGVPLPGIRIELRGVTGGIMNPDIFCGNTPVSYTHLDVYKRQAYTRYRSGKWTVKAVVNSPSRQTAEAESFL